MTVHDISPYSPTPASNKRKRFYFCKSGMKDIPLPGVPGSEEFMQAYAMAFASLPGREVDERRTAPGTNRRLDCKDQSLPAFFRASTWSASLCTRTVRADSAWIT